MNLDAVREQFEQRAFDYDQEFLDGTSPRIYPWNQSKIENPQAPAFTRGVASKI